MNELALFSGAGGGILGGKLLGWRTICAVERDAYAAQVLAQRQNDGILEAFPIWSDVSTFDGRPWRGLADVISGGFPCQDISAAAGKNAKGIEGERSKLWVEMYRIICEVRPRYVFVENSPILTSRGLGRVLGDLAASGFNATWGVLGASDVGADHERERIWIVAHAISDGHFKSKSAIINPHHQIRIAETCRKKRNIKPNQIKSGGEISDSKCQRFEQMEQTIGSRKESQGSTNSFMPSIGSRWPPEPGVGRMVDGVAFRVDRLKSIGNGQVPRVAATAFELLRARLKVIESLV